PDQPANSRRNKRKKPRVRKAPPPIDVNYRMAYVGTFSIVDRHGDALVTRRYHATHEEGPQELVSGLIADVKHAMIQKQMPLVIVQDGAPELWNELREPLRQVGIQKWHEVIDRFHVNERLGKALELVERNEKKRAQTYAQWQWQLDRDDKAILRICRWLDSHVRYPAPFSKHDYELLGHTGYLNDRRIRYASKLKANLPIGSGVTEGACKSLVMMRAKRSGQRWQQ